MTVTVTVTVPVTEMVPVTVPVTVPVPEEVTVPVPVTGSLCHSRAGALRITRREHRDDGGGLEGDAPTVNRSVARGPRHWS